MARKRDPNRDKSFEIYKEHNGEITNRAIAEILDCPERSISGWKSKDKWNDKLNGVLQSSERSTPMKVTEYSNDITDVSWVEIETEYVTDIRKKPCTLRDLAEKYGVSERRVEEYASLNKWREKRGNYAETLREKTNEKTIELISDDAAIAKARHFNASNKLLEILEGAINAPGEFNKVVEKLRVGEFGEEEVHVVQVDALAEKRLSTVVASLASIQKMQRETLDIVNAKEELARQQMQLNKDKTKAEIERLQKMNEAGNQETTEEKLADYFKHLQEAFKDGDGE